MPRDCIYSLWVEERAAPVPGMSAQTSVNAGETSAVQFRSRALNDAYASAHAVHQKRLAGVRTTFLTA